MMWKVTTASAEISMKLDQENDTPAKSTILLVKLTFFAPRVNS